MVSSTWSRSTHEINHPHPSTALCEPPQAAPLTGRHITAPEPQPTPLENTHAQSRVGSRSCTALHLRLKGLLWIHLVAVHFTPLSTGQPVCMLKESSRLPSGCTDQNMNASPCVMARSTNTRACQAWPCSQHAACWAPGDHHTAQQTPPIGRNTGQQLLHKHTSLGSGAAGSDQCK